MASYEASAMAPALALFDELPVAAAPKAVPEPKRTGWEGPLAGLMAPRLDRAERGLSPEIGLLFELVTPRPRAGRRSLAGPPGIRVRPVTPSTNGRWVKSGITWNSLDYFGYGRPRNAGLVEKIGLLKEFVILSQVSDRFASSYVSGDLWLEDVRTRRVWDLLRHAGEAQVPLLGSGRRSVVLATSPAEVRLDITRSGPGLAVEAVVEHDGERVPLECSLLLGTPAHGVAWWDEAASASGDGRLHLAPLAAPVDEALRAFMGRQAVRVPGKDVARFVEEFVPGLRRKVPVRSSDESVELPAEAAVTLVLRLTHGDGHRLGLSWAAGREGSGWRESVWDARDLGSDRDRRAVDALVAAVEAVLRPLPRLFEWADLGKRLACSAELAGMEAVRFVTEVLPDLVQLPGVEIEEVGTAPDYRAATEAPVVSLVGTGGQEGDWYDLTVEITVGGEKVAFQDLFVALARDESHLILPSGTFFALDAPELRQLAELIAEARNLRDASGERIRVSRYQAGLWEDLRRLGVVTAQADAWVASVRELAESTGRADHPVPKSLQATLRPYQEVGFNWLAFLFEHRLGGVLADDMGLGKTVQALALMCHVYDEDLTELPFLVIAPTSVVANWAAECRRFAPDLAVATISETEGRRGVGLAEIVEKCDVVITSYALFRLEYDQYKAIEWGGLFVDEAQFAKNHHTKTYQQIKMLPVAFKVAMTGTPMENNLMELWSVLSIAAPGLFSSPERFEEHFRKPIEKHADDDRLTMLRRRIKPLMLRRTKEQVAPELPDRQEQVLELELSPRHRRLYQTYLARERQKILGLLGDMTKNRFEIFRSLTLLRQASLDVSLVDPAHAGVASSKLDALMEMLGDIVADGHRVLVFSQFTRFLGAARKRIEGAGISCCYLDGRTRNRAAVIGEFRGGDAPVFLISLKAGGFGLNLTEADYCILLDPWWNPATEAQAVDRVHRIGQTRKVMVYRLVAKDTIEDKVMALKARKNALFANVLDSGGFESGALSAADIRGLLD